MSTYLVGLINFHLNFNHEFWQSQFFYAQPSSCWEMFLVNFTAVSCMFQKQGHVGGEHIFFNDINKGAAVMF